MKLALAAVVVAVTGVFYGLGWAAGRILFLIVWAGCSIADGFTDGRHPSKVPPGDAG